MENLTEDVKEMRQDLKGLSVKVSRLDADLKRYAAYFGGVLIAAQVAIQIWVS